jgi:RHS repeat-associated protein
VNSYTFSLIRVFRSNSTGSPIYLRARSYQPQAGRFTQRDTYGGDPTRPQSLNRFTYVENNPSNRIDPSGHNPLCLAPLLLGPEALPATALCEGVSLAAALGAVALDAATIALGGAMLVNNFSELGQGRGPVHTGHAWPQEEPWVEHIPVPQEPGLSHTGHPWPQLDLPNHTGHGWPQLDLPIHTGHAWPEEQAKGPIILAASNGEVSRFQPSDIAGIERFADEAPAVQAARGRESFGSTWKIVPLDQNLALNTFIYRTGERVTGMMIVTDPGTILHVSLLESFGGGAGTRLLQAAIHESAALGYQGRLALRSAPQALTVAWYESHGFVLKDGMHYLSVEVAQRLLAK